LRFSRINTKLEIALLYLHVISSHHSISHVMTILLYLFVYPRIVYQRSICFGVSYASKNDLYPRARRRYDIIEKNVSGPSVHSWGSE